MLTIVPSLKLYAMMNQAWYAPEHDVLREQPIALPLAKLAASASAGPVEARSVQLQLFRLDAGYWLRVFVMAFPRGIFWNYVGSM